MGPSRKFYFIPIAFLLIGIVIVVINVIKISEMGDFQVAEAKGGRTSTVEIFEPGKYYIYIKDVMYEDSDNRPTVNDLQLRIYKGNQEISIENLPRNQRQYYNENELLATVTFEEPGTYTITLENSNYDIILSETNVVNIVVPILFIVFGSLITGFLALVSFLIILFIRLNKINKQKQLQFMQDVSTTPPPTQRVKF